jgi:hypothetical protein
LPYLLLEATYCCIVLCCGSSESISMLYRPDGVFLRNCVRNEKKENIGCWYLQQHFWVGRWGWTVHTYYHWMLWINRITWVNLTHGKGRIHFVMQCLKTRGTLCNLLFLFLLQNVLLWLLITQLIDAKTVSIMLIYPLKISIIEIKTQAQLDHNNDGGMFTNNIGNYRGTDKSLAQPGRKRLTGHLQRRWN